MYVSYIKVCSNEEHFLETTDYGACDLNFQIVEQVQVITVNNEYKPNFLLLHPSIANTFSGDF